MKRKVLLALSGLTLLIGPPLGADSCKTSGEKLKRDSKELEETSNKLERERGCEPNPPYACPKSP